MGVATLASGLPLTLGNGPAQFAPWVSPDAPATFSYYVDGSSGGDARDGKTLGTAWLSFAHIKNDKFPPGTTFGLKRGSLWRQALIVNSSGTQDAPIIIGAYGAGPPPRISGGSLLAGFVLSSTDGAGLGTYSVALATNPGVVLLGGVALTHNTSTTDPLQLTAGQWLYTSATLYVKQFTVSGSLDIVEIPARAGIVSFDNQHDIIFRDLHIDLGNDRTVRGTNTTRITLLNMAVTDSIKTTINGAIGFINGSDAKILNVTMRNIVGTLPIYSGGHSGLEIAYCDIRCDPGIGVYENLIHLDGSTPPSERYSIHHNYLDMLSSVTSRPIINAGTSNDFVMHTAGGQIAFNTLNGGNAGININNSGTPTDPIIIQNNIIQNYGLHGSDTWPAAIYCPMAYNQANIIVRDNVFLNGVNGVYLQDSIMPDGSTVAAGSYQRANVVFQRNVIQNMSNYSFWCASKISGEFTGNTITNTAHPIVQPTVIGGQTWTATGNINTPVDYYVSNSGIDSNAGSILSPFLTIGHAISVAGPSKTIALAAGSIFREAIVPLSGQTFVIYGTGAAPVITGFDLASGWTLSSGNVYQTAVTTAPTVIYYNGKRITQSAGSGSGVAANRWDWLSNILYLNVGGGSPTGTTEISQRGPVININAGKSDIIFDGLQIDGGQANVGTIFIWSSTTNINNITIRNCSGGRCGYSWLFAANAGYPTYSTTNVLVYNNIVSETGEGGIQFGFGVDNSSIVSNTVTFATLSSAFTYAAGIRIFGQQSSGANTVIAYNIVHDAQWTDAVLWGNGNGIHVDEVASCSVFGNRVYNCGQVGILLEHSNGTKCFSNLVYNNVEDGIIAYRPKSGTLIYQNTSYGNKYGISVNGDGGTVGEVQNNIVSNNIAPGNSINNLRCESGGENSGVLGSGNVYVGNCFGPSAANFIDWGGSLKSTYTAWETAYGATTSSVQADPLLSSDFHLYGGSPCIKTGQVGLGVATDLSRAFYTSPPNLGAFA